ncbi:hypothetical protein BCR42DRAFT_487521 [Absidia repens]|uniref:CRIB domain-containing protein n=1 Tax=Absidia repens TaxID=90262 RepID=A0A1X2IX19_9FUNG|nr:hypothetical protein BCR42DRAFT_487521 [Absidia repens]
MGSTLSKAKQIHLKTFTSPNKANYSYSDSAKVEVDTPLPLVEARPKVKSAPKVKKTKHRKHHHHHPVGSISVNKRTKPKYKKVTKSIIGKPTNFKHTNHMGPGDILGSSVDVTALSNELNGIAHQINCFEQKLHSKQQQSPPAPPPHLYISASVKKRAAATTASSKSNSPLSPVVPISFRRRQYRKAVPHHNPNLGLVNALMIEIPTLRSVAAS